MNYKSKLTAEEQKESIFISIGRLRTILKGMSLSSPERTLELFEKIVKHIEANYKEF